MEFSDEIWVQIVPITDRALELVARREDPEEQEVQQVLALVEKAVDGLQGSIVTGVVAGTGDLMRASLRATGQVRRAVLKQSVARLLEAGVLLDDAA